MKFSKVAKPIIFDTKISDIPLEVLRELYRVMLKIQRVELKIDELYHQDEMKTPVHLCLGQEAVAAGVCCHLNAEDYVFSNHRGISLILVSKIMGLATLENFTNVSLLEN